MAELPVNTAAINLLIEISRLPIRAAIIAFLDELEKAKKDIDKEKEFLAEEEKKNNANKEKWHTHAKEIEEKLHQLKAKRDQVSKEIAPDILGKYEKILLNRDYNAIVPVENNACQGCFMQTSPQVINLIKMYDQVVVCEECQRILYIKDDSFGDIY